MNMTLTLKKPTDRLLSVRQLAERLNVREGTIYMWVKLGKVPCLRLGRRTIRFSENAIELWLQQNTKEI